MLESGTENNAVLEAMVDFALTANATRRMAPPHQALKSMENRVWDRRQHINASS
jgi:hypothetical protein